MRRQYILYGHGNYIGGSYQVEDAPKIDIPKTDQMLTVREIARGKQYYDYGEYAPLFFYEIENVTVSHDTIDLKLRIDILEDYIDPLVVWHWWTEKFLRN